MSVTVEGETDWLVPDLYRSLSAALPAFLTYGEDLYPCIPLGRGAPRPPSRGPAGSTSTAGW